MQCGSLNKYNLRRRCTLSGLEFITGKASGKGDDRESIRATYISSYKKMYKKLNM
jgi:hypothetical protein